MLSALAVTNRRFSEHLLCSMSTAAAGEGGGSVERAAPTLVPLTHRHSSKRSSSPLALHPEGCSGFLTSDVTRAPLQQQSTQPRPTSPCPAIVAEVSAASAGAAAPATATQSNHLDPTTCSTSSAAAAVAGGGRTPKRLHKTALGSHVHGRASSGTNTSGSHTSAAHGSMRTASERCKTARTLAAELMSALMERPPAAAQIAHYRQAFLVPSAGTPQREGSSGEARGKDASGHRGSLDSDGVASSPPTPSLSSPSFLEAVRSGRAKSIHTPASTSPPFSYKSGGAAVQAHTTAAAVSGGGRHGHRHGPRSPSPATALPPADPREGHGRRQLELMPCDAATIPPLLAALREVALCCGTLDSLSRPPSFGQSPHASGNDNSAATTPAAAAVLEGDAAHEAQWQQVRTHLQVVCELVLNAPELATVLDDALGSDWRSDSSPTHTPAPAEAPGVDALLPVMPTPVDHDSPSHVASAKGGGAANATAAVPVVSGSGSGGRGGAATTSTASTRRGAATRGTANTTTATITTTVTTITTTMTTTTTTTTLNHNARPFHSRTPPSFPQPMGGSGGDSNSNSNGTAPVLNASALTRNSASNTAAPVAVATSMKQLSESSSTYSPSQHVTTFLERTTPPASGRFADEGNPGLLTFPSTPLSETATPYQPSAPVRGSTSPRGGNNNISTSSSTPFHLESREEMLRRRSAAPNAFYASMTHSGATHYLGGPPSAATTPGAFIPSSVPQGCSSFVLSGSGARSMPVSPILSYGSPVSGSVCPYDYILVLDFEATCEEHPPPNYLYEIIEFPVVVVDVRLQRVVAEFHRIVRPRHKVQLSEFCRELTGMHQEDVNAAAPLEEVILQFERWFAHTVPPQARCVFATDGPMDMREFMYHHSVSRQGVRFPPLFYQYIDVKQIFACFFHCAQGKIKAMLEVLHVPFEGRLHSGLDDARNIAAIVIGLLQYGSTLCEVPLNRLPLNGLLLSGGGAGASTPLSLPPSTAAAGSSRRRSNGASPANIAAPYSVDEDEYSY